MCLSHDGDTQIVQGAPSTMLRMVPLPRRGRGGWGSHIPSPCGDVVLKFRHLANTCMWAGEVSVPLRGCGFEMFYMNDSMSNEFFGFRPLAGMCSIRLPRRNGGGGERCEPVGALTADVTFSRWRYADRSRSPFHHASHGPPPPLRQGRLGFAHSVPLRGCGFEIRESFLNSTMQGRSFRPLAGMWF